MAARLRNVLYWVGCIVAAFVLTIFGLMWVTGGLAGDPSTPIIYGVIAVILAPVTLRTFLGDKKFANR
jgi:hypothetical protein